MYLRNHLQWSNIKFTLNNKENHFIRSWKWIWLNNLVSFSDFIFRNYTYSLIKLSCKSYKNSRIYNLNNSHQNNFRLLWIIFSSIEIEEPVNGSLHYFWNEINNIENLQFTSFNLEIQDGNTKAFIDNYNEILHSWK